VSSSSDANTYLLTWLGASDPHLDRPATYSCGHVVVGVYGGNTRAGARKNEDASLVMVDPLGSWEFALLIDAHHSAESARLILDAVEAETSAIGEILEQTPLSNAFRQVEQQLFQMFASTEFRKRARAVQGEASCLLCARKKQFLWWMSIGDCVAYVFHPHLAALGQFALNQRSFYEWVGRRNTFELPVPCYTTGVRELRPGHSVICMVTDGVFEITGSSSHVELLYQAYRTQVTEYQANLEKQTLALLQLVHRAKGRDSATVTAWHYETDLTTMYSDE
jgi:serine/threonine protein phosphatase PrpC